MGKVKEEFMRLHELEVHTLSDAEIHWMEQEHEHYEGNS